MLLFLFFLLLFFLLLLLFLVFFVLFCFFVFFCVFIFFYFFPLCFAVLSWCNLEQFHVSVVLFYMRLIFVLVPVWYWEERSEVFQSRLKADTLHASLTRFDGAALQVKEAAGSLGEQVVGFHRVLWISACIVLI